MTAKFKIVVAGIGGVGGFIGGKLAAYYSGSGDVDVIFLARGENEKTIRSKGLLLITPESEQTTYPSIVINQPQITGGADLIICCMKSYDLEESFGILKPCINEQTIILPLLNGVDASSRIRKIIPQSETWEGCMYIVSRRVAPAIVKVTGNLQALYFGSDRASPDKLVKVKTILNSAGITAILSGNITQTIWEKFLFISPLATLTSYLDSSIGKIVNDPNHKNLLLNLLAEVKNIADAKGIFISDDIMQKILDRMNSLPYENTSSMHSDFQKGGKTELESLTGYVVQEGKELGVPTPNYDRLFAELRTRSKSTVT